MSRTLPSECEHGYIHDYGDFGCECGPNGSCLDDAVHNAVEVCPHGCNEIPAPGSAADKVEIESLRAVLAAVEAERDQLRAKLDMPCGSCHPCENWADETWRREGKKPPAVITWEDTRAELWAAEGVLAATWNVLRKWSLGPGRGHMIPADELHALLDDLPANPERAAFAAALLGDKPGAPKTKESTE